MFRRALLYCFVSAAFFACSGNVKPVAQLARPTGDSVRALFGVMHLDVVVAQLDQQIGVSTRAVMAHLVQQQAMNAEQRRLFDELETNVVGLFEYEYSWDRLGLVMFNTVQAAYTQQDVDALLSFFKSAPGRDVVAQLPVAVQALTPEFILKEDKNPQSSGKSGVEETLNKELESHLSPSARDALAAFASSPSGRDFLARAPESQRLFQEQLAVLKADAEKRMHAALDQYQARMKALGAVR
jgi:hypothetical protein